MSELVGLEWAREYVHLFVCFDSAPQVRCDGWSGREPWTPWSRKQRSEMKCGQGSESSPPLATLSPTQGNPELSLTKTTLA